jgi:hypothetical protein
LRAELLYTLLLLLQGSVRRCMLAGEKKSDADQIFG